MYLRFILLLVGFCILPTELTAQTSSSTFSLNLVMEEHFGAFVSSTATFQDTIPLEPAGFDLAISAQTAPTSNGSTANVSGSAFITDQHLGLGLAVESDAGNETSAILEFVWRTEDRWTLNPQAASSTLPNLPLTGNFTARASAIYSGNPNSIDTIGSPSHFEVFTGVGLETISMPDNVPLVGGTTMIDQDFGVLWSNAQVNNGAFSLEWRATIFLGGELNDERLELDGTESFVLNSITFSDGTTPESHDFDIVFDSGRRSPNVTSVPEPAGLSALLAVFLCVFMQRRNRCWAYAEQKT